MPSALIRRSSCRSPNNVLTCLYPRSRVVTPIRHCGPLPRRFFASVNERKPVLSNTWFSSSDLYLQLQDSKADGTPAPDERTIKLGKTIRTLRKLLPDLLTSPLPQEILSPHVTLQLFPSTHPHLPTVKGRIAYTAALWTAPVAWGRVPVVGNVKLVIVSERMARNFDSCESNNRNEKLIVRWKTCRKGTILANGGLLGKITSGKDAIQVGKLLRGASPDDGEFSGLFIFEFDEEGRVQVHTIEHVEEGRNFDKMTRVVSVTDWLLGKARGNKKEEETAGLALGMCESGHRHEIPDTRSKN